MNRIILNVHNGHWAFLVFIFWEKPKWFWAKSGKAGEWSVCVSGDILLAQGGIPPDSFFHDRIIFVCYGLGVMKIQQASESPPRPC